MDEGQAVVGPAGFDGKAGRCVEEPRDRRHIAVDDRGENVRVREVRVLDEKPFGVGESIAGGRVDKGAGLLGERRVRQLDMALELRPAQEAVLAGDDELRIGEASAGDVDMRRDRSQTVEGVGISGLEGLQKFSSLLLVLLDVGARGNRGRNGHRTNSFHKRLHVRILRLKEVRYCDEFVMRWALPFPRTGRALGASRL